MQQPNIENIKTLSACPLRIRIILSKMMEAFFKDPQFMALTAGTLLNSRYRIISTLGQGGMGAVYHAIDENLGIAVAVKENLFLTDEYARQFQREASILAGLRHPNLTRVSDYFTLQGQGQYLIMDYIDGEDLRMRLERLKQLPEKEVIIIGVLICEALSYLHSRKPPVVHRDIKPGNIKITPEGEILLVDFGLAKVMSTGQVTTTGARAMTPGYSPPEQYGTARTDPRSDIYSLGATLYAALTGLIPEDGLARATGKVELTQVRTLLPKVNRRLAAAMEKALAVDPEMRYQNAELFRNALLEAGDINTLTNLGRITIPPPPLVVEKSPAVHASEPAPLPEEPPLISRPASSNPRPPARLQLGGCLMSLVLVVLILVGLTAVIFIRPDLPVAFLQQILPTATAAPTPVDPVISTPTTAPIEPTSTNTPLPPQPTATSLPTQTASPTPHLTITPVGGGTGQIAFASNRTGTFQIWVINTDGSNLIQLTHLTNGACQPAWSPDGDQMAFVSPCRPINDTFPGGRIYTMKSDGSDIQSLQLEVNLEGDFQPSWSPDGKHILYTSVQTGRLQIFVYNLQDNTSHNLSNSRSFDFGATWAPNGKYIAFVRQISTNQIWLMTDKGENQVQFNQSDNALASQSPAWTPDSQLILFNQVKNTQSVPWLMAQRFRDQGTNQEFHVPPGGQDIGPVNGVAVSPDGFLIAYESWPDGKNHDIFITTINGADRVPLTTDIGYDFGAAWRPRNPNP
jgi:eukaryotic-like serine/threonine-protein kinase